MSGVDDDDWVSIDEVVETWVRVHQEYAEIERAADSDLSWWHEALQCLRPTAEDVPDPPESDPDDQAYDA